MKTIKNILFVSIPTILILLLILEVFFRTVIRASDPPMGFFDEKEKMYFFDSGRKDGLITLGKSARIKTKWHINNMHWNYPIDYYPRCGKKLISVIGDSYIEAFQVDVDKNYPYLLREKLKPDYEVYAFGKSGAPLSQYLHISRYVNQHFDPDILIFNLVHNDFDESILELNASDSQFVQVSIHEKDSITETRPRPDYSLPQYRSWKRFVYKSALFRYLYLNLKVTEIRGKYLAPQKYAYEGNINPELVSKNRELIVKATGYLVRTIRSENMGKRVIFVFDAPREAIYNNSLDKSSVKWMHEMVDSICKKYNMEHFDLSSLMNDDYRINRTKFNSDIDGHWNVYGHQFVANAIYNYLKNTPIAPAK